MCVPIQRVRRDAARVLTHIGGSTRDGVPWGLTIAEAVARQEARLYDFFVEVPAGERVGVFVKTSSGGKKFLTTAPDGIAPNNLDALPDIPHPLSGVEPAFPLNIPGIATSSLMSVRSIGYGAAGGVTPLASSPLTPSQTATEFNPPASMWTQNPRWFHLQAVVPYPARYLVFQNGVSLERVPGDSPARRRELGDAGKGWWTFDLVLTKPDGTFDPTKPTRLTEVKVVIRPGAHEWAQQNFVLSLCSYSVNPYCLGHGNCVSARIRKPPATVTPPPATATLPDVVGQRLDLALMKLYEAGFRRLFVVGPTALSTDLKVDALSPAAGTVAKLTESVYVSASFVTAPSGVKTIAVSNQSNRAKPMDLWLFDYQTGAWDQRGTVAYQGQEALDLTDGHTYLIAAVDATLLNCHTNQPGEASCVYQSSLGTFSGDEDGVVVPWQIL